MKQAILSLAASTVLFTTASITFGAEPVDFNIEIKPILESACLSCHGPEKPKGSFRLDTKAGALKGGEKGVAIVAGKPDDSPLYKSTVLPLGHEDIMPPKGSPLARTQSDSLRTWIAQGASWPDNAELKKVQRIDFEKDIQPLLELNCVACHQEEHHKGGLRLDKASEAFKGGETGPAIVRHRPKASPLYTSTIVSPEDDKLMPPKAKGGPLPKEQTDLLASWIEQGAAWPLAELNVPMMVLSQLSRAVETRQGDRRPQLSDLRDSGSIEQDADLVAFIFREEVYNREREDLKGLAELILAKQRNGPVGTVNLVFLHAQTKFENRAEDTGEAPEA
jgi:mono/diheme cytochrome c family protein